jgi:DNA polymerase I
MGTLTPAKSQQKKTHLLIDGDVVAFIAAAAVQGQLKDDFGWVQPIANVTMGEAVVENMLHGFKTGLNAESFEIVLSDPDADANWRKQVHPSYKTNRTGPKPLILRDLKEYLGGRHRAYHWAGLEADDVLGVLMTKPRPPKMLYPDKRLGAEELPYPRLICVGRDKDFKSIPGLHHTIKSDVGSKGELLVREVSQWEADRWHLIQTLAGDRVDGFPGCPGIGMERAASIIDNPVRLVPKEGVKTRGVNKGESVTRWMAEPTRDYWACIVSHYHKAGLDEEDALKTARMARILRFGEYDPVTESLTLWTPDRLSEVGQSWQQ